MFTQPYKRNKRNCVYTVSSCQQLKLTINYKVEILKTKFLFLFFISMLLASCDPENDFFITGKVTKKNTQNVIENAKIELICYTDNMEWNFEKNITRTDKNGIFNDTIISLRRFNSIKIKVIENEYSEKEIISEINDWKISRGIMKTEFKIDYGNIKLIKK